MAFKRSTVRPRSAPPNFRFFALRYVRRAAYSTDHLYDHAERSIINGTKIFGLSVGCYTHPEMIESGNKATVAFWWRGIVLLEDLDGRGYYDAIRAITQRKILREYL